MSANESRRRIDPEPNSASITRPRIDNTLSYQGRELEKDSMRLVEIQSAVHERDPVVCTMRETTFGSRPKFEALSYMWGTEPPSEDDVVTLNDHPFQVGRNLLDALFFLRRQVASGKARQPFWIDAICINQNDVEERNRQLRLMDQIYFRASTVVVWLGSVYTKFQEELAKKVKLEDGDKQDEVSPQSDNEVEQIMVRNLRTDPYWDRLWILQEIGRAYKLRVCFGGESCSWERFMHLIAMHHSDGNTGPLRLDSLLRKQKYNDSHTLKRLLEEHREAKCSEPRDKVYGLVGLASDAAQFPMNYKKSLYEVWKDTMVFMNHRNSFKEESQILPIGALVKTALMGNNSDPLSQIYRDHEDQADSTQLIEDEESALVFCLGAVCLGCIIHVEPTASDVISRPSEALEWRTATQRLFPANELGPAYQEHDNLLRALLESDETEIEMKCFNRPSTVLWRDRIPQYSSTNRSAAQDYIHQVQRFKGLTTFQLPQMPQETRDRLASVQPRLYLATKNFDSTSRKMGVASGLVQLGDLVCWVRSSRKALLVRVSGSAKVRVFGTALATEDVCVSTSDCDFAQRWESLQDEWKMDVRVDADTIFTLLN